MPLCRESAIRQNLPVSKATHPVPFSRRPIVKHSGMFVFLQRFVIKKRQNQFLLGALSTFLPSLPPSQHLGHLISRWGLQGPRVWKLEPGAGLGYTGVNRFIGGRGLGVSGKPPSPGHL